MQVGLLSLGGLITAIIAIVFGVIVMIKPRVLAYLIGIYLIIVGVLFFVRNYF